jgi:hypothetical protein
MIQEKKWPWQNPKFTLSNEKSKLLEQSDKVSSRLNSETHSRIESSPATNLDNKNLLITEESFRKQKPLQQEPKNETVGLAITKLELTRTSTISDPSYRKIAAFMPWSKLSTRN